MKYEAKIVPFNGIMGTYWEVYILNRKTNVKYDVISYYLFSVAQKAYENRKQKVHYLNKENQ